MVKDARGKRNLAPGSWGHHHDCTIFSQDSIYAFLRQIDPSEKGGIGIASQILEQLEGPGSIFYDVNVYFGQPYIDMQEIESVYDGDDYNNYESSLDVLSSLGVVRLFRYSDVRFAKHKSYSADVGGAVLTNLGVNFYDVCRPEK
ncbi:MULTISPECIES: hypothetical protein [Sphingobium]|uniref:hypothetical protein n=1 Tax=Sphingobium TaxID=165695 RepID=UPI0015EC1739|nr:MULTISPECIES: hypothetical protein [Sphingobium]MCW2362872.1 hypothetical protein [Sphingobium sp. B10D3B]MCW2400448.1 hypothetical protein [Sphingobium sp. B10D7B]MCW2407427.1 hypothetical protein [Sphingobium xanthum]